MAAYRRVVLLGIVWQYLTLCMIAEEAPKLAPPADTLADVLNTTTYPTVYMDQAYITVKDTHLNQVPIRINQSDIVNYHTSFELYLNTSASQSRYAYLEQEYITIEAGDDNFTTYLRFDGEDSAFSTNDSIYTIGLKSCIYCELGVPTATVLTVQSSKTVNVSFSYDTAYGYEGACSNPEYCYKTINVRTNLYLNEPVMLPLLIKPNSTATYSLDYYLDSDPPVITLNRDERYHSLKIYIKDDKLFEGTEYFYLSFDEVNFPDGFEVGEPSSIEFRIEDDEYGLLIVKGNNEKFSESAGTVEITIETNIIQETEMLINITTAPYYDSEWSSATPGEDYVPFHGLYYIPAGENTTTITVTLIDDDLAENEERISFVVELYSKERDITLYEYGHITIEDDETKDNPLVFSFVNSTIVASESSGTLNIHVRANIKNDAVISLEYLPAEKNGMVEYRDYTAFFNATIRRDSFFFAKSTEYVIEIHIIDDCDVEDREEVTLLISQTPIGSIDPAFNNVTIIIEDDDSEGDVHCAACSCSGSVALPTDEPTTEPGPQPLMFYFELDEFTIYEGECSYYDINVLATQRTNATVFIGVQPWELTYGDDFTISDKKLVFQNSDRQNFSFRAIQDMEDENVESTLVTIAYVSDGEIGQQNAILVNVMDGNISSSEFNIRNERSVDGNLIQETSTVNFASDSIATGLVAGLVSSLFVVMVTGMLLGISVVIKKKK
ncbi:uncharacterized protein [Apostichopus japonicus]|uniref:uncharacterized protein n=1 Tax=Stichopus japonicus TaxID=307972 RepID=UPI003AB5294E